MLNQGSDPVRMVVGEHDDLCSLFAFGYCATTIAGAFLGVCGSRCDGKSEGSVLVVALRIKGPLERTASLCLRCITLRYLSARLLTLPVTGAWGVYTRRGRQSKE